MASSIRRLLLLLGIGLIHLTLIWYGDILALYALCGFAMLLFRNRSDRTLLTWVAVLLALPVLQYAAVWAVFDPENPALVLLVNPGLALIPIADGASAALGLGSEPTFGTGGWRDLILFDLVGALYRYGDLAWTGRFFKVLGIFLLGLWTGRRLYGIGMGLWQRVGPLVWTGIGLVLFAGQVAASAWWLRRFRYGPMEWLWRRLTYGQPLPMRAPTTSPAERRSTLP